MNAQNTAANDNNSREAEVLSISMRDIFKLLISKWYWFVLSVLICVSVASIYLMSTPKIYQRTSSVLVKDVRTNPIESAFSQDLGLFGGTTNVNNEVIIFKSHKIMAEAARRLKLDVSYSVRERLRDKELYTNTPVSFAFIDAEETQWVTFKFTILPDDKLVINNFITQDMERIPISTINLNDTIDTPIGKIVASPTLWYNDSWYNKEITVRKFNMKNVIDRYRAAMFVDVENKVTAVINLSLKDVSIMRAEDVLNTVIEIYNEEAINEKNQMAIDTEDFIHERLLIIGQELGAVDDQIISYKTVNQITDINSAAQLALQEGTESDKMIFALRNQRAMASYIREHLSNPSNSTELIPANSGIDEINIEAHIVNYNQTLLRRNKLIEGSSERNIYVQQLNTDLISLRQNIMRAVDNLIFNLDIQLRSAYARTERSRTRISAVPQQQADMTSIGREQQIKSQLFLFLLNKREENAINKAITQSTARIIDVAHGSSLPVAPRRMTIMIAAFILGLIIPVSVLYVILSSDITVRNRKDIISALSIPFLGEIPYKKVKLKDKKNLSNVIVKENGRDPASEAFRILRTNMDFMRVKQDDIKVITTTSMNVGSGKTFVATNLAVSLTMAGKKVLLIDMDIRKGTLAKNANFDSNMSKQNIGLTSYLSKLVTDIESLIFKNNNYPGIDVIYSGPEAPNPAELLLSSRLDELINKLRDRYDMIVIDNVPSGMIADALITNRITDMTLYVIRAGKLDRRMLPEIEQMYHEEKLKNMAVVLNGVGDGMSYGYGYGYGYGTYGYR